MLLNMRRKRWQRRMVGAVIGLVLGWWAAGFMPGSLSSHAPALAEEAGHNHADMAAQDAAMGGEMSGEAVSETAGAADHEHESDGGQQAAAQLVPTCADVPWLGGVLVAIGGLFVLAILIGWPLSRCPVQVPAAPAHDDAHGHGGHH